MKIKLITLAFLSCLTIAGFAQQRSAKRGIGWDEKIVALNANHMQLMQHGVDWVYNWGPDPENVDLFASDSMSFAPMCWNGAYDEKRIRDFVKKHPETRYLLGFNEPNFNAQANMSPETTAKQWPRVEKLADELGLRLVGPALNFSGEVVGGRIWSPYEWLDEFLRIYPKARMDCLALHCYMNWYSSTNWFVTEYIYKDLYDASKKDVYGKYPHLVAWLDECKAKNGSFPRMMLTEFCSWENDGTITGLDFQLDQMTQKLQMLEQSDIVEGYAWFMANGAASAYPYYSVFESNSPSSTLSTLGTVYVNLSSFDRNKFYAPDENVLAKDYVDATKDAQQVKVRPNTDVGSTSPLQIEIPSSGWVEYQIDVPRDGRYKVSMHMCSSSDNKVALYVDGKRLITESLLSTAGEWGIREFDADLKAGQHSVMFYNTSPSSIMMDEWKYDRHSGITDIITDDTDIMPEAIYDLNGCAVTGTPATGIYVARCAGVSRMVRY